MVGISTSSVVASDADGAERALDRFFPTIRFDRATSGEMGARVSAAVATEFSIVDYAFLGPGGGVSTTDTFTVVHSAGRDYSLMHGRTEITAADAFLAPAQGLAGHWSSVACLAIALDPVALGRIARTAEGRDDLRLHRTGYAPLDRVALRHWHAVVTDVRRTIAEAPELLAEPMIERSVFEQLATAFLHAFPTNWRELPEPRFASATASLVMRRALDYLHAHAGEAITVEDLARAAAISTRGLHYAFTRELGEAPRAVLQRVRLERARAELVAEAESGVTSVAGVARRWGFTRPAEFAVRYERAFGEPPSVTLGRP